MPGRFFSRWYTVPHREPLPRTACRGCAGGGELNGLVCPECDGLGYFDENNQPRTERSVW